MRKAFKYILAVALLSPLVAIAGGQWTGKLVDTRCMAMNPANAGNDHKGGQLKNCATACAKMGIPVALLVDGKMHTLAVPAAKLADHMAKTATVKGKLVAGDIILPEKVTVDGKDVNIGGMM